MNLPEIKLAPDTLFQVGPVAVSNAMFTALVVSALLLTLGIFIKTKIHLIPGRLQVVMEMMVEFYLSKLEMAMGSQERARKLMPFIVTISLFLVMANQLTLIPFIGSITAGESSLFKTPTSHYSLPIALAVLGIVSAHLIAFATHPIKHLGNFFKFHLFFKIKRIKDIPMAMIEFFLGLMDIIGELAKMVSLSTRLFGNLFAGEVVIGIISGLLFATQFIIPIPFIILGILSGFVQTFVFSILLAMFMSSTLTSVQQKD